MNYSKQRELIFEYVKSVKTHPTAEEVYNVLKNKINNLSLGTVYRNLSLLTEFGKIRRIKISYGKDRFDGNTSLHPHAICLKCGKIFDIDGCKTLGYDKDVENILNCKVLSHDLMFNILCSNCKNI